MKNRRNSLNNYLRRNRNFKFTIIFWSISIILLGYSSWGICLKVMGSESYYKNFYPFISYVAPLAMLMGAVAFFVTSYELKKARLFYNKSYSNMEGILCATLYAFATWFLIRGIQFILVFFVISREKIWFMNTFTSLGAFIVYLIGWSKVSSNKYKLIGLIPFLVFLILIITTGFSDIRSYKRYVHKPFGEEYQYLGEVGGKKIYGFYGDIDEDGYCETFAIKIDDELLYMETDDNKDGKADDLIHFEIGREAYSTHYDPSMRNLSKRVVEYYDDKGHRQFTISDRKGNGEFVTRIKYLNKEPEVSFVEIFVNGKWLKIEKKDGFIPVKYDEDKGNWKMMEAKKD
jgi:hypothetical protein